MWFVKARRASDGTETWKQGGVSPTLNTSDNTGDVRATILVAPVPDVAVGVLRETAHTLTADGSDGSEDGTGRGTPVVSTGVSVRRLTPTECERLQGFPDGWTATGTTDDGSAIRQADSPRYRELGNSVAVPVLEWICRRIVAVEGGHHAEQVNP